MVLVLIGAIVAVVIFSGNGTRKKSDIDTDVAVNGTISQSTTASPNDDTTAVSDSQGTPKTNTTTPTKKNPAAVKTTKATTVKTHSSTTQTQPTATQSFDLFAYCKEFALEVGEINGDYCIYQQPASKYGGYDGEYFSISYWNDSDLVEFCLHCPLDETLSINFYLRMRGGYNKKYEYTSSKYFRDTGESLRYATGIIDPAVFSDHYTISCDRYEGSTDGQNEFMEESRVGVCNLIDCLKEFVEVENMECDFSAFDFVNF